jgi:hypothetical protein
MERGRGNHLPAFFFAGQVDHLGDSSSERKSLKMVLQVGNRVGKEKTR